MLRFEKAYARRKTRADGAGRQDHAVNPGMRTRGLCAARLETSLFDQPQGQFDPANVEACADCARLVRIAWQVD